MSTSSAPITPVSPDQAFNRVREILKGKASAEADTHDAAEAAALILTQLGLQQASHYEILNVPTGCSEDEIRGQFRKLAREFHPDKHRLNPAQEAIAAATFRRINWAFEVLGDPQARFRYDRDLLTGHATSSSSQQTLHQTIEMGIRGTESTDWATMLACAVSRATFTEALFKTESRMVIFIGTPTNVKVAIELYHWLRLQMEHLEHQAYRAQYPDPNRVFPHLGELMDSEKQWCNWYGEWARIPKRQPNGAKVDSSLYKVKDYPHKARVVPAKRFRFGFMMGCAERLFVRLQDFRRCIDENTTAVVRMFDQENTEYIDKQWGKGNIKEVKTKKEEPDARAYAAGFQAGDQVRIEADFPENFPQDLQPLGERALRLAKELHLDHYIIEWRATGQKDVVPQTTWDRDLSKSNRCTILWIATPNDGLVRPAQAISP